MVDIGDIVERRDPSTVRCSRGRVTSFAPNGFARVKLENGQSRIWPTETLGAVRGAIDTGRPVKHIDPDRAAPPGKFRVIGSTWKGQLDLVRDFDERRDAMALMMLKSNKRLTTFVYNERGECIAKCGFF